MPPQSARASSIETSSAGSKSESDTEKKARPKKARKLITNMVYAWATNVEMEAFIQYLCPIYCHAASEKVIEEFVHLLRPVWFDRFPIIFLDGFDYNEQSVGPDPQKFYEDKTFTVSKLAFFALVDSISPACLECYKSNSLHLNYVWQGLQALEI
ncbi:hypothetical protein C0992_012242 [Termitomyces sp. T32_za158]|nr:hypothetical protein C0992_012242 [Termitomyces sp. T32_za158]